MTTEESRFSTCQWIDGDPKVDPTKCGQPNYGEKSYCLPHCRRAYTNFVCAPVQQAAAE